MGENHWGANALDWVVCYFTGVTHRDPCSFHFHHLAANFFFLQEYWNVSLFSLFVFIILFIVRQETGFWFIFHHVPTGPSEGLYSPGHTEHTPMGHFTNNRAHSNYRVSFRVCKWQIVFVYKCLTRPTSEYQQVFQSKGKTFIVMYKLLQTQWHWI